MNKLPQKWMYRQKRMMSYNSLKLHLYVLVGLYMELYSFRAAVKPLFFLRVVDIRIIWGQND